jgi:hypothetical protein
MLIKVQPKGKVTDKQNPEIMDKRKFLTMFLNTFDVYTCDVIKAFYQVNTFTHTSDDFEKRDAAVAVAWETQLAILKALRQPNDSSKVKESNSYRKREPYIRPKSH